MVRWLALMPMALALGLAGNFGFFAEHFISTEKLTFPPPINGNLPRESPVWGLHHDMLDCC